MQRIAFITACTAIVTSSSVLIGCAGHRQSVTKICHTAARTAVKAEPATTISPLEPAAEAVPPIPVVSLEIPSQSDLRSDWIPYNRTPVDPVPHSTVAPALSDEESPLIDEHLPSSYDPVEVRPVLRGST